MSPTFTLWHPVFNNVTGCEFDVKPYDFQQVNHGTRALMTLFLQDLGIDAEPATWDIARFCSPYYSDDMDASNWHDRYSLMWRVRIAFARPCSELPKTRFFGPHPSNGVDPSWKEDEDSWKWSHNVCVVIADFWNDQWRSSSHEFQREAVFRACRSIESVELGERITQGRFILPETHFPDDEDRVAALVQACESRAFSVNWMTTLRQVQSR